MAEKQTVLTYKGIVRLAGSILNEIPRTGMTDREIRLLRHIHGDDGVVQLVEDGAIEIDPQVEAYELAVKYSKSLDPTPGVKLVEKVLNVSMSGFAKWNADREAKMEAEREEGYQRRQAEIAEHARIRDAAEAMATAAMKQRAVGIPATA